VKARGENGLLATLPSDSTDPPDKLSMDFDGRKLELTTNSNEGEISNKGHGFEQLWEKGVARWKCDGPAKRVHGPRKRAVIGRITPELPDIE
jgi:hypothetical protein